MSWCSADMVVRLGRGWCGAMKMHLDGCGTGSGAVTATCVAEGHSPSRY